MLPAGGRNGLLGAVGRNEGLLTLCQLCRKGLRARTPHFTAGAAGVSSTSPVQLHSKRRGGAGGDPGETQGHKKAHTGGTPAVGAGSSPSTTAAPGAAQPSTQTWQVLGTTPRVHHPFAPPAAPGAAQCGGSRGAACPCSLKRALGVGAAVGEDGSHMAVTPASATVGRAGVMQGLQQAGPIACLNRGGVRTKINLMGDI